MESNNVHDSSNSQFMDFLTGPKITAILTDQKARDSLISFIINVLVGSIFGEVSLLTLAINGVNLAINISKCLSKVSTTDNKEIQNQNIQKMQAKLIELNARKLELKIKKMSEKDAESYLQQEILNIHSEQAKSTPFDARSQILHADSLLYMKQNQQSTPSDARSRISKADSFIDLKQMQRNK